MSQRVFSVSPNVFDAFPDYIVGGLAIRNIQQSAGRRQAVTSIVDDAVDRALSSYGDFDIKSLPAITAWRKAFSAAGWSASRFPASVEALVKRTLKTGKLPAIHPIVDLVNAATLTYLVPIGLHDVSTFSGDSLEVRYATDDDIYVSLSGEHEVPAAREIVYAVGSDVRTRRWVWRQSRTALTSPEATDVFIPIDGFAAQTKPQVEAAAGYLVEAFQQIFDADVSSAVVSRDHPTFSG